MASISTPTSPKPECGIKPLPQATVRQIGASQVAVDPSSVVKELIENALDARATAIFVDISANTLSSIEVRDNGHGIPDRDRALVCSRYCTSKIRAFQDLKEVGAKWLGFRGEAMASMAEVSGSLDIITRVESEPVAVLLKYGRNGELQKTSKASQAVGTTVKVTDLFHSIPVRKQDSLKHSAKWLARIRHLMQSYALTRPIVRFQLRVLNAKSEKANFNYAPKSGANVEDAAFKVVGTPCASQCEWTAIESDGYQVCAFLPKPDAQGEKVANSGTFLAVDYRPVSSNLGTMKKITTIVRGRLRKANPSLASVKDPFVFLNLLCSPGSYDPTIEPAKDDVLFENEKSVLRAVEVLVEAFYPIDIRSQSSAPPSAQLLPEPSLDSDVWEVGPETDERSEDTPIAEPSSQMPQWRPTMYGVDEEDLALLSETQVPVVEEEEGARAAAISNPWTIAKMNASIKPRKAPMVLQPTIPQMDSSIPESSSLLPRSSQSTMANVMPSTPLTPVPKHRNDASQLSLNDELQQSIHRFPGKNRQQDVGLDSEKSATRQTAAAVRNTLREANSDTVAPPSYFSLPSQLGRNAPREAFSQISSISSTPSKPGQIRRGAGCFAPRGQRKGYGRRNDHPSSPTPTPGPSDLWFGRPMRGTPVPTQQSSRQNRGQRSLPPFRSHRPKAHTTKRTHVTETLDDQIQPLSPPQNNTDIRDFFSDNMRRHQRSRSFEARDLPSFTPVNLGAALRRRNSTQDIGKQLRAYLENEAPSSDIPGGERHLPPYSQLFSVSPSPTPGLPGDDAVFTRTRFMLSSGRVASIYPRVRATDVRVSCTAAQIKAHMRQLNMRENSLEWGYPPYFLPSGFAENIDEHAIQLWGVTVVSILDKQFERRQGVDIDAEILKGIQKLVGERTSCPDEERDIDEYGTDLSLDEDGEMLL